MLGGLLVGCPTPATHHSASGATCVPGSTLSYESFGRPFFATYCVRCHGATVTGPARNGAPVGMDFDTVDAIRESADRIDHAAARGPRTPDGHDFFMPWEDGPPEPTLDERDDLGVWLACGAP